MLASIALVLVMAQAAAAANAAVAMQGVRFVPASVTVSVGDSVTWTNQDGIAHSARADNGSFDTGLFTTGSRSVSFGQAGTFGYFCAVHPSTMRGTVTVMGAATPPPATARPTPPPTVRPSPPPPTLIPSTPTATAPPPSATPTAAAAPASPSPTETPVAVQISPTASPTAGPTATPAGSSLSGEGPSPLLVAVLVAAAAALTGVGIRLIRR